MKTFFSAYHSTKIKVGLYSKYMAINKKRLSKTAKEALKKLNESKLLANSKASNASASNQTFKPAEAINKNLTANKLRPDKKRG